MMRYFLTLCWALLAYILTVSEASAGPVFVALMANGVAFGAALGATAVGAFMSTIGGRLLSSVALSALSRALGPKTKQNASGITTSQTATGGTNPVGFVLGKYATAGDAVCPPMTHGKVDKTPNAYLTYVIAVGDVAGQTLDRVAINGAWVDIAATVNGDYGNDLTGIYAGYAWVKYYDGTQTVADPMLRAKYGSYPERPWLADMIGTGVPYVIFTFRYNREVYTEFPSVLIESGGIKLYDPRKDTTIGGSGAHRWGTPATYQQSTNPIVMAYNISRGITIAGLGVWGGAIEAVDLPTASWFSAMNTCDVTTGTPAVAQFRAGYEVRVNMEPAAVIEELFKGCAGEIAEVGGEFKVRVGGPGLPVMFLTDDDIVVSKAQDYDPFPQADGRQNGIDAKYPDPAVMWIAKSAPSLYNTAWETEDGERRVVGLDLPACPYPDQVQRIMAAYIADERRFRRHNMTLAPDAAILEPLDVISWTSARNSYTAKLFDLAQLADDVNTALQRVSVREVDASDFVFTGTLIPAPTPSPIPVAVAAQTLASWDVQPLSVGDGTGTPRRPGIVMTWSVSEMDAVEAVQYQVRVKDTGIVVKIGTVADVAGGRIPLTEAIVQGVTYQARGMPVAQGRATSWTAWLDVTAPSVGISSADLSAALNATISNTVAAAAAAQAELDQLTAGLVTDVNGALASIEARTRAGLKGWLLDPIFSRWSSGNLTAANWFSRSGTSVYGSKVAGLFGSAMAVTVPSGSAVVQVIARSDAGMQGANPDEPYLVITAFFEMIAGDLAQAVMRCEWSPDGTTWTRGDMLGLTAPYGTFAQHGITLTAGVVQGVEVLVKRPAGTFAYVRLVLTQKNSTGTSAHQSVWHLLNVRSANEAERNAWNVPAMQATITTQGTTISGQTSSIATLTTDLSSTNTTASNAASAAAAAATLAGSKGKVIYGSTAPVVGDQAAENLWIDTTSGINAPKRWLGGAWVIVRDKVAVDAAAAATAAQSTADAVTANLSTNYLTTTGTNTAIAAVKTELSASIQPYQAQKLHSDFRFGDYYWAANYTQSVTTLPAAAYPSVAYPEVTLPIVAGVGMVIEAAAFTAFRNISERTHRPFVPGQKMRFRMKMRLTANPSTGVHSTRLWFAMTDAAGAYLGLGTIIATFSGTVVADGWVVKEFIFEPATYKGSYAATGVNWRLMVQLSGINSAVQQVEWIEFEDVTTDTGLQAAITSIQAVDISALTGTALATLLTQLGVAAGGSSAWVTSQTSAVATLNSNAAASYSLRIGAGGASAGFEIVATDDPVSGAASTIKLSAKHVDIFASSVRISDSSNVYPDFDFADPLFYASPNAAVVTYLGTGVASFGKKYMNIGANAAMRSVESGWFNIEPSTEYLATASAFMSATVAGAGTSTVEFEQGSVDNFGVVTPIAGGLTAVSARIDSAALGAASVTIVTGASARRGRFVVTRAAGGTGVGRAAGFKLQKKAGASLIVDGAIFANHLSAESVTTEKLNAESVTAAKLSVDWLNAGRISASFLDVDNLLTLQSGAGLSYGKTAVTQDSVDGIYFGVSSGNNFGLAASRTGASGAVQAIKLSQDGGLQIKNAKHVVSGTSLPTTVTVSSSTGIVALPAGTKSLAIDLMGGGAEGWNAVATGQTTETYAAGATGGNTVVKLYDGTTLMATYTAAGGTNAGNGTIHAGQNSSLTAGGAGGTSSVAAFAGSLGSGGGGGYSKYVWYSGSQGNYNENVASGRGGLAGQYVNVPAIDMSGYAAPKIEVVSIGAGGDGVGNGGAGGAGRVVYVHSAAVDTKADVVPLTPTATGSFSKAASVNGTFPNLGAGIWVLRTNSDTMLNIGNIQVTVGHDIWVWNTNLVTLISDKTPTWTASANARTIYYTFYSMGSWGA